MKDVPIKFSKLWSSYSVQFMVTRKIQISAKWATPPKSKTIDFIYEMDVMIARVTKVIIFHSHNILINLNFTYQLKIEFSKSFRNIFLN